MGTARRGGKDAATEHPGLDRLCVPPDRCLLLGLLRDRRQHPGHPAGAHLGPARRRRVHPHRTLWVVLAGSSVHARPNLAAPWLKTAYIQKRRDYMKWVTRERPKVDRVACPWLIKRFVDPQAQFLYVAGDQVLAVAEREQAIPFDVPGVELGHHGDECSFDAIIRKYNLIDPALQPLALIVRGADTAAKDLTPESRGLEAVAEGFRLAYQDDQEQLEHELPVYDALYAYCRQRSEGG